MLNIIKDMMELDMRIFGNLLYKLIGKLEKYPMAQTVAGIVYITGMNFDMKVIELIDRRTGA